VTRASRVAAATAIALACLTAVPMTTSATAAPASALGLAHTAPAAAPQKKEAFSLTLTLKSRVIVPSGNAQGIGDVTVETGTVERDGAKDGTFTVLSRVLAVPKKGVELRDAQITLETKKGTLQLQAVNEEIAGQPFSVGRILPIVGGTGDYAGARGTCNLVPQGDKGKYLALIDLIGAKGLTSSSAKLPAPQTVTVAAPKTAKQGITGVTLKRAVGSAASYTSVATRVGSSSGKVRDSVEFLVTLATGTLFARGVVESQQRAPKPQTYAVLGGTGEYAGYRGELTLSAKATGIQMRLVAPTGKKDTSLTWSEMTAQQAEAPITGGTFATADGPIKGLKGKPTWVASIATYVPVGDVTPVITMLERTFDDGTLVVTGMTDDSTVTEQFARPIVGGTGAYAGAGGEALSTPVSATKWDIVAAFWR